MKGPYTGESTVIDLFNRIVAIPHGTFSQKCVHVQDELQEEQCMYVPGSDEWMRLSAEVSLTGLFMNHDGKYPVALSNEPHQQALAA